MIKKFNNKRTVSFTLFLGISYLYHGVSVSSTRNDQEEKLQQSSGFTSMQQQRMAPGGFQNPGMMGASQQQQLPGAYPMMPQQNPYVYSGGYGGPGMMGASQQQQLPGVYPMMPQQNPYVYSGGGIVPPYPPAGGGALSAAASSTEELIDPDAIMDEIKVYEKTLAQKIQALDPLGQKTRVIVLGVTGAGKSTVMHAIAGKKLIARRAPDKMEIHVAEGQQLEELSVGHLCISRTTIPVSWYDSAHNLFFWDCPGFMDSRGAKQDIINAFAVDSLFTAPSRIKILLIMQQSEITETRAGGAFSRFDKLEQLLTNYEQLQNSLSLVVTKGDKDFSTQEILMGIKGREHSLLTLFKSHPERVFSFFKPAVSDDNKEYIFADRERLFTSLQSSPVLNPAHSISLEDHVVVHVLGMIKKLDKVSDLVPEFMRIIQKIYRNNLDSETLRFWKETIGRLLELSESDMNRPEAIIEILNAMLSENTNLPQLQELLEKMSSTHRIFAFITKVSASKSVSSMVHIKGVGELLRPLLLDSLSELVTLLQNQELVEEQQQKTKKIEEDLEQQKVEAEKNQEELKRQMEEMEERAKQEADQLQLQLETEVKAGKIAQAEADQRIREFQEKSREEIRQINEDCEREILNLQEKMKGETEKANRLLAETQLMIREKDLETQAKILEIKKSSEDALVLYREQAEKEKGEMEARLKKAEDDAAAAKNNQSSNNLCWFPWVLYY